MEINLLLEKEQLELKELNELEQISIIWRQVGPYTPLHVTLMKIADLLFSHMKAEELTSTTTKKKSSILRQKLRARTRTCNYYFLQEERAFSGIKRIPSKSID